MDTPPMKSKHKAQRQGFGLDDAMPNAEKLGRLLIFIVAYNAEKTIENVLQRIPEGLSTHYDVEVLIIDDSSQDNTFLKSEIARRTGVTPFRTTVLFNPVNQGYGGNQKIGFHYSVKNEFDWVALVHGDGQYAPECLPELLQVLVDKEADAVFGSRMLHAKSALQGGMPLYKYVGNKILTRFQNTLLKSNLSEFHSGYRLYSTTALTRIPFDLNSNDFHFDTEIIIQLVTAGLHIKELAIPTFYGDEICHVNGLKYAWNVCRTTIQARIQKYHIFYDRKFDCLPADGTPDEALLGPSAAETATLAHLKIPSNVRILGEVSNAFLRLLEAQGHRVSVESQGLLASKVSACEEFDYLLLLDDADISNEPEQFVNKLRMICRFQPKMRIVVAVANIGFFPTRFLLFFGRFSYSRKGVISLGHSRFFTLRSLKKLFIQNWFGCNEVIGLPIQYSRVFESTGIAALFSALHRFLIKIRPSLFSYQLLISVSPKPSLDYLLESAIQVSEEKSKTL